MARRTSRGTLLAAGSATLVLLAGCGTTVRQTATGGNNTTTGLGGNNGSPTGSTNGGLTGPASTGPASVGGSGANGVGGSSAGTSGVGTAAGSGSGGGATTAAGPAVGPLFAPGVPGVTPTSIYVGLGYAVNSKAANAAVGANKVTQGDEQGYDKVMLSWINSHGGVLGRKLVPVWHQYDASNAGPVDTQFQAACADYTQGPHKSFVVFDGEREVLLRCLQNAGVFEIEDNVTYFGDSTYRAYPYYFNIANMSVDRMAADEVPALAAQHYFTGWNTINGSAATSRAKVGVLTYDHDTFSHAVDDVLIPALARLGYAPAAADVIKVAFPQQLSDDGTDSAEISNAILKFRQHGVTHVLIIDGSGVLTLLFANNAESQHYFPRYGFNTQNAAEVLVGGDDVQPAQFVGSLGIGWSPPVDIRAVDDPDNGPYSTPARRTCLALMARGGYTFSDPNAAAVALGTCSSFNFLVQVLLRTAAPIDRDSFARAVGNLGTAFVPTDILAPTSFGPDKHYGAGTIRYLDYFPSCTCMKYTSGPIAG